MPLPKCASCSLEKRTKLLKCFHGVCVSCLPNMLTRLNEVRCPHCTALTPSPGEGRHQLLYLPDNCTGSVAATADEQKLLRCEDCFEEKTAVSRCADCNALLCEYHASGHPHNRATYKHRIEPIDKSVNAELATDSHWTSVVKYCLIHPERKLQTFCSSCDDFLCEICLQAGHDATHTVTSALDAATEMRELVQSLHLPTDDGVEECEDSSLSTAIETVSDAIQGVHDQTEALSESVEDFFTGMANLLKARQERILQELDQLRLDNILPLEKQKQRLQNGLSGQQAVSAILEKCKDPFDFVRMSGWLQDAIGNAARAKALDSKQVLPSDLVFNRDSETELSRAITQAGGVALLVLLPKEEEEEEKKKGVLQVPQEEEERKKKKKDVLQVPQEEKKKEAVPQVPEEEEKEEVVPEDEGEWEDEDEWEDEEEDEEKEEEEVLPEVPEDEGEWEDDDEDEDEWDDI